MKKLILTTIMFLSIVAINAQSVVSMSDQNFTFSTGQKECIKVIFKDVSAKNVESAFKEYFKKNYKAKVSSVKKTTNEFEVEEFKANDIQQKPTSVNAVITELEGSAILYIHYKSDGYVVSEKNTPIVYEGYRRMTQGIANDAITLSYADVIAMKEKELYEQEKALDLFLRDNEKQDATIAKMQAEIKTSEGEVSRLTSALSAQKVVVSEKAQLVKDKEVEMANLDVKSLEKEIKSIEGDNKSADRDISKLNSDIAKKNADIAKLQSEIKTLEAQIETVNSRKGENGNKIAALQTKISSHNEDALKEQLKILEKDKKDAESAEKDIAKSIEKEASTIEKNNISIKESQLNIATLRTSEEAKKLEIAKTKEELKVMQTKVSSLK